MRALLTSHGSTGDIYPVIRLGKALVDAGHQVRFVTMRHFQPEVERAGLEFISVPPDWDQQRFAEAMRELSRISNPLAVLEKIYREALPFLEEFLETLQRELAHADVFVGSYLFPYLARLARQFGVPSVLVTFAHNAVPTLAHPPNGAPRLSGWMPRALQDPWNALLWHLVDRVIGWRIRRVFRGVTQVQDLLRNSSFALEPADLVLVAVSKALFKPERLWSERFVFSGYLRWQSPEDPEIERQVQAFCGGERLPFLTFGSVTFDEAHSVMSRFMRRWPKGKKRIIQAGWADLTMETPGEETLCIGKCSHDQLFPKYASVVIHHGGAGTTASALHAGVPQVVIPHIADQSFFAGEVERLGVGIRLNRKHWPEKLADAISRVENRMDFAARAAEVAQILANEDGPRRAVAELEALACKAVEHD